MLNYKKPIKVKSKLMENQQVTIAPADPKTQVIKAGNKTIGTVSNPTVANQLKTAIQKGEVNLAQDLKEEAPPDQEQWVKDNKEKFIKQYGKKGEAILYATAWQRHNKGVKESKELDLDKLFESVAFDEPDPVSHILSKFKFEVNQFCQGQQINPDLYDCLYDYYLDAGLMPYGVAKARDANPIEWVSSKLKEYLGQCGVSQQTSPPVDSPIEAQNEQPVPEYGDDVEQQVSSEPTEQEIDQMFESILGKPLTSKIKESKMKVTQPKRKQVAESSIDRKSKLMEAVDPKSVYIVVKNVPRLRGIKCDIGITYELSYDPDDDVFSAVAVKFVDMETGQKYAQTQFQELAYKQLMLFADKDATKRANDNDLEPQDFTESGRQKPIVKEILKASKTVTRDFFAKVSESSIDRKARQLVDSWNLKLKQKLKESVTPKRKLKEGVSISTSQGYGYNQIGEDTTITVSATDDDARKLAQILRDANFGQFKDDFIDVSVKKPAYFDEPQESDYCETEPCDEPELAYGEEPAIDDLDYIKRMMGYENPDLTESAEREIKNPDVRDFKKGMKITINDKNHTSTDYGNYFGKSGTLISDGVVVTHQGKKAKRLVADMGGGTTIKVMSFDVRLFNEQISESADDIDTNEVVKYIGDDPEFKGELGIVSEVQDESEEYEVIFASGKTIVHVSDLEEASSSDISNSDVIVKYIGDDSQFEGRYGVIIEEDGDEYHVAFSDGQTWIVASDLEAPALQESFANELTMNQPAQTAYMTHGISGGLNSLRRSQATGNVTRISTMESKGKGRKMLKESKQAVGKPSDELASMANLVEAISVQQRIKFGA